MTIRPTLRSSPQDAPVALLLALCCLGTMTACSSGNSSSGREHSVTNSEDCASGVSWWGTVQTKSNSLTITGCVNDDCLSRDVSVSPDMCAVKTEWKGQRSSSACAVLTDDDAVEVVFSLDLTLVAGTLSENDIGRLTVADTTTGNPVLTRQDPLDYVGTVDAGTVCRTASIRFDPEADL